ncbi:MAG: hypothetical protein IIZ73_08550 [Ruminococcus sp.]|nr:hypothetical protein [Ruminococcus sp.]
MDESKAIAQVIAAYEKLLRQSGRIQTLEKKLADGTITMKEGAELNDLRAKAFGRAFSGSVLGIERGSREGACVDLLKDRCADVDELAQAAQKAVLARQGLNLTPPTAPFEEDRARKIGHSLEDETVPDETIERRARSATENMIKYQYDRNMKKGAATCASAGLKTYIIRDSGSGCCKWCDEVSGKFVYGSEPKDVYRRHDNCTCTVVYESGRGRQNVWSKQYWSQEQEREYLRLRDEMAPKRLNAKQAQALRERVGELTFGQRNDIIKNIVLPSETDEILSMSAETKQLISNAIDSVLKDYDVKIDEFVTESLDANYKNVPFQFQPQKGKDGELIKRLVINENYDFRNSQEGFQARINKNFNNKVLASNSVEGLIAHELAHILTFQDCYTFTGYLIENKKVAKKMVYGISRYADASNDGAECIAEAFAAKRCNLPISEEAQKLLDEYIERWRKK